MAESRTGFYTFIKLLKFSKRVKRSTTPVDKPEN
jgi:hypothetical protein